MKNIFFILTILFIAGCSEKDLDVQPTDKLTDELVWATPENANLFLNDIYNNLNPGPWSSVYTLLPTEVSNDPLDNFSDNSVSGPLAGIPSYEKFVNGSYGPAVPIFDNHWANMYRNIRKANVCIEKVSASTFPDATKKSIIAQARFLRIYFYKSLIDLYGGVPIITNVLNRNIDPEISFPRNTYEECIGFIQKEVTEILPDLPLKVTGKDLGRVTRGAALALKGELELYAGKFAEAAATNLSIMNSGAGYGLFPDYGTLFHAANENNSEVIFDVQYAPIVKGTSKDSYWGPVQVSDGTGYAAVNPTQNLVDDYEFTDGKTASEGSALYNPASPYTDREKRFYASIIYDGSTYRNGVIYTRLGVPNNRNEFDASGAGGKQRTGYLVKKSLDPTVIPGPANLNTRTGGTNIIIWRYAEVLLNYAEAKNEVSGPDASIFTAINLIRKRAGLPDLPPTLGKEELRQRIRRERRVELAFEGKRLFDLWRWRIAEQVFNSPLKAMKITVVNGTPVYERVNVGGGKINFVPSKNYLMPIPQSVIDKNPNIVQNPGY